MPSPFPGMDPFIESQHWESFHHRFIIQLADALVPLVRPRYVVLPEERSYIEHAEEDRDRCIVPDVSIGRATPAKVPMVREAAAREMPVTLHVPVPSEVREVFLTIRNRNTDNVVTVIEVLSPANKREGSDGRETYLSKREAVLRSFRNLVELDVLRGGARLPTIEPLPAADFYAFVIRGRDWGAADVYPWTLRHKLPAIPIPLERGTPDVEIDLQQLFDVTYDRAGYDYALQYDRPVEPALGDEDSAWVKDVLEAASDAEASTGTE